MEQEQFLKELNEIENTFYEKVRKPLIQLVQDYIENNEISYYNLGFKEEIKRLDDMALLTAWVTDKLKGYSLCDDKEYKKTLTKKMLKTLGFIV